MATKEQIAIVREKAVLSLKETGAEIAAKLNINPPDLNFFFRDKDLHQAEELKALADFNRRVLDALEATASVAVTVPKSKSSKTK